MRGCHREVKGDNLQRDQAARSPKAPGSQKESLQEKLRPDQRWRRGLGRSQKLGRGRQNPVLPLHPLLLPRVICPRFFGGFLQRIINKSVVNSIESFFMCCFWGAFVAEEAFISNSRNIHRLSSKWRNPFLKSGNLSSRCAIMSLCQFSLI